jgi:flavin-binding protein dodecin
MDLVDALRPGTAPAEITRMSEHVYKSIELTGSSKTSCDDAIRTAIAHASKTVRNIRWFHVIETRGHVNDGKVEYWQVTLKVGFTLE